MNAFEMTIRDMSELPRSWMDGEIVYPSGGMVFELAYLKCPHLSCSLRRRRRMRGQGRRRVDAHTEERGEEVYGGNGNDNGDGSDDDDNNDDNGSGDDGGNGTGNGNGNGNNDLHPLLVDDDESELEYQVALLLCVGR
jgi:hypothetical protein